MVSFWRTPRGYPSFLSPRCRHPLQPYTTNAAFRDLWTMQPSPGGLTQTTPLSPQPFLVSTAFFCLGTVRHFAGTPAVALPLRRRVGRSLSRPPSRAPFYPSRNAHDCPHHAAVATRSSPPASPLRWALVIFFSLHRFIATAGRRCTWNLELSLLPHNAAIFWESC